MISKSPKDLYKTVSKNLASKDIELSEEVCKKFTLFVFGKIENMISSLEHMEIYVPKLGFWKFRKVKGIYEHSRRSNRNIEALLKGRPQELIQQARETYETRLGKIQALIERHDQFIEERKKFKEDKHGYRANKRGVQKQEQDLGRTQEQDIQEGAR